MPWPPGRAQAVGPVRGAAVERTAARLLFEVPGPAHGLHGAKGQAIAHPYGAHEAVGLEGMAYAAAKALWEPRPRSHQGAMQCAGEAALHGEALEPMKPPRVAVPRQVAPKNSRL